MTSTLSTKARQCDVDGSEVLVLIGSTWEIIHTVTEFLLRNSSALLNRMGVKEKPRMHGQRTTSQSNKTSSTTKSATLASHPEKYPS